jgi:hypothetical protein
LAQLVGNDFSFRESVVEEIRARAAPRTPLGFSALQVKIREKEFGRLSGGFRVAACHIASL